MSNHTSFRVLPRFLGFSLVSFEIHLYLAEKKDSKLQEGKYNHISQSYLILKATTKLCCFSRSDPTSAQGLVNARDTQVLFEVQYFL